MYDVEEDNIRESYDGADDRSSDDDKSNFTCINVICENNYNIILSILI